jgi:hypothetical protein
MLDFQKFTVQTSTYKTILTISWFFINVCMVVFLFNTAIYVFLLLCLCILIVCLCIFILPAGTLRLPWLWFFHTFSSVVRQIPGYNPQRWGMARTLPKFLCCSMYCLFCVVLCIVCVQMCIVLLPPGGNPIAVNKYIISYHLYTVHGRHNIRLVLTAKPCTGHKPEPFNSLHAITNTYCFKFRINCNLALPTKTFTEAHSTKFCTIFLFSVSVQGCTLPLPLYSDMIQLYKLLPIPNTSTNTYHAHVIPELFIKTI